MRKRRLMQNRIFVCGDTHIPNDIQKLNSRNFPEQKELTKKDVLIQLGDFGGIWYAIGENKEQEYWLEWLALKNFTTAVVLGNHENYDIIETLPWTTMWDNDVQYYETPKSGNRIYFLKRGAFYNINGKKILAIGGAHSIDKLYRTEHISWWSQEDITHREIEACFDELDEKGYEADYILSHTCPSRLVVQFLIESNAYYQGKITDTTAEFLDEIDNRVEFKGWFFGHMHIDFTHTETSDDGHKDHYTCCYNDAPKELTNWSPEDPNPHTN